MEYPKIHSLFKRQFTVTDPQTGEVKFLDKGKSGNPLIIGDYAQPEFPLIKRWHVEEKVDGTNIRIMLNRIWPNRDKYPSTQVTFGGRTKDSHLPSHLLKHLQEMFTPQTVDRVFDDSNAPAEIILFGEGYGPKIQACGANYRKDAGFILFDVKIGHWWLKRENVYEIAHKFGVPYAPGLGIMTEEEIIDFVKSKPLSRCSVSPHAIEGVICRPEPLLLFRDGSPLMFKLKCRDFDLKG